MSSQSVNAPPPPIISIDTPNLSSSGTSSVWDRLSTWASENKAVVYTVGAVVIVATGAGAVYYFSDSTRSRPDGQSGSGEKKRSKKERREAKKAAEEAKKSGTRAQFKQVQVRLDFRNRHAKI
jgi:import receptor subunit TOM70